VGELGSEETISAAEVGIDDPAALPFEFRPGVRASPLVVSFPHVGLDWPAELGPRPQVNFPRNADYAVDRLYVRAEGLGAATVRARYSRLVVDLNRAEDDVSSALVPDHPAPRHRASLSEVPSAATQGRVIRNRGVVWEAAVGNIPLLSTLSYAQLRDRIARFHRPYYRALALLLERRRQRFGYAILIDAHSMPGTLPGDLVLGTRRGRACGPAIRAEAEGILAGTATSMRGRFGSRWPLSLAIDDPYQGGEVVATFGKPDQNLHAIQLEVSRAIYMDERRCDLNPIPDPRELSQVRGSGWSRAAQSHPRERRRIAALVGAIDTLLLELTRERTETAASAE
jgi:N-formylglutamate amidohydrolase